MSYNAITTAAQTPIPMTPSELQSAIEANTRAISQLATTVGRSNEQLNQALNFLVSEFIRPNTQQHLQSMERLERLESIVESVAAQQQASAEQIAANAQQIASNAEAINLFDSRLEETRQLVAQNSSQIAQLSVKQERNADQIAANAQQIAANAQQVEALAETSRSQLAGIIGNGRRIDRLEQQAS